MTIDDLLLRIQPPDQGLWEQAQRRLDRLTKPPGSLGRLEELAARYVMLSGTLMPDIPRAAVYTFAADHGIVQEGVSAYPSAVTAQMVLNFLGEAPASMCWRDMLAQRCGSSISVWRRSSPPFPS